MFSVEQLRLYMCETYSCYERVLSAFVDDAANELTLWDPLHQTDMFVMDENDWVGHTDNDDSDDTFADTSSSDTSSSDVSLSDTSFSDISSTNTLPVFFSPVGTSSADTSSADTSSADTSSAMSSDPVSPSFLETLTAYYVSHLPASSFPPGTVPTVWNIPRSPPAISSQSPLLFNPVLLPSTSAAGPEDAFPHHLQPAQPEMPPESACVCF
jgi:hypothetical protein